MSRRPASQKPAELDYISEYRQLEAQEAGERGADLASGRPGSTGQLWWDWGRDWGALRTPGRPFFSPRLRACIGRASAHTVPWVSGHGLPWVPCVPCVLCRVLTTPVWSPDTLGSYRSESCSVWSVENSCGLLIWSFGG